MTQKLRALALVLGPVCLVFVSLWVGLGRNAAASPSPFDTPPDATDIILDAYNLGRLAFEHEAVLGPQCVTASGDPFSPINSTLRPPGYYTNPQYPSDFYTYRYRIDVPADYGFDVVRVELFDPDTYNHSPGLVNQDFSTYVISHTLVAIANGLPATETFNCNFGGNYRYRYQPCMRETGEDVDWNPLWFVKVDEIRAGNGISCGNPSANNYNNGHPTQTAFDLYYYGQTITGTTQMNPIANYMGRMDNAHDTDLRWVSPGGAQSYDQPTFVPANSGSFEVDLTAIPDILVDPATGVRSLYLDVTTLAGASENGFEIWAGPAVYTGPKDSSTPTGCGISGQWPPAGTPSQVNKRNLFVTNCGRSAHDPLGVTTYALDYAPTSSNTNDAVDIPVTYLGPEYAGQSIYVTLFDSDSGARGPIVFYFDTLAFHLLNPVPNPPANPVNLTLTDFYRAFSVNNTVTEDPDLIPPQTRNCPIGSCGSQWVTPSYRIDIPTLSPDCVDVQTTPLLCTPFYGGTLMARYIAGETDTYAWHVDVPDVLPDIEQSCTGVFPIALPNEIRSVGGYMYDVTVLNNTDYPATPPSYPSLFSYGHRPDHKLIDQARSGDVFLLKGQGVSELMFTWLRWGSVSQPDNVATLASSLTWPGDSALFEESGDPTDTTLHQADWVALNTSSAFGTAAATQLQAHIDRGRFLRLPLYWESGASGIRISRFANFEILAYRLSPANPADRWLLLRFVAYSDQCGQTASLSIASETTLSETLGFAELPVTLSGTYPYTVTVDYNTQPGTALPNSDYTPVAGTLMFAPGEKIQTIAVPILDDPYAEYEETFTLRLSNPVSTTLMNYEATVSILPNDGEPSYIRFAAADQSISESAGSIPIVVRQDGYYTGTVWVDLLTLNGTALSGQDYTPISLTVTFPGGVLSQTINIPLTDDNLFEGDETFQVKLRNPFNGVIRNGDTRTITILNDDAPPELSFAAASPTVSENVSSGVLSVTVQLAPTSGITATLAYSTSDGTATAGLDYQPVQGIIAFTAGTTSAVIPVPILNDALAEGNEWFHLTLSDPVNGVITGTNPAQIFIVDDECLYNLYAAPGRVEAENFTCGGEGVAYHDTTPANEGDSTYRLLESVDVWDDAAASHTHYVGGTEDGEWLVYTVEITATGRYDLWVAAASIQSGSCFRVEIDGNDVTGQVVLPVTGGVFGEVAAAARLTLTAGTHQIRLAIPCGGADFDYLSFIPSPPDELFLPVMLRP